MRDLHCYKVIFVFIFLTLSLTMEGQHIKSGGYNFRDFQDKPYYFGLTLGYNSSKFQLLRSNEFILNDSFKVVDPISTPGFNVSMIANMKIGDYFDFRFLPGFSFGERDIFYINAEANAIESTKKIESVFVQMPFHVRFKSVPYKDMRMFVIAGVKYTYDVASNARVRKSQAGSIIRISPHDYALEVGAGMQFFFPFFIFSPEIKFSQGIGNILIYNDVLEQSRVLEKILSRAFTISLHFEG